MHGTLFGVLRNRRFQARNYFDPGKAAYTRAQSGLSTGGPIKRNKTFFYAAYERLDRHESQIVPLLADRSFLTSLTESQQSLVDALRFAPPTLTPLVNQLAYTLVPANNPAVVSLFEENSGVFPFGELRQQFITRVDHTLRDGHNLFFRGNWTGQESDNTNFGALTARSRGRNSNVNDFAVAFGDTWVINPRWVSETRVGLGYHDFGVYPTDEFGPAISIGAITFGRDFILPTRVAAKGQGFGHNLLADFTLSGIVVANSFAPFNLNTGFDSLGDRHTDTHRPWGLGRNAGIGPAFFGVDMRLTRLFSLSEAVNLQVSGEAFNLLNRTNFKTVNGVVGNTSIEDLPAKLVGQRGPVTEPLSFASAFDPRQFQFTLRLTF